MEFSTARRPTVVLVDDHPGFLPSIRRIMQTECDVVATLENGQQAIDTVCALRPDIVVLDIAMPVVNGLAAARRIREAGANAKIVFLTVMEDIEYASAARELDASYIVKRRMHEDLMKAVRMALAGKHFCSPMRSGASNPQ
jgi:DNA-binding NarL/FixJ family response regulator